MVTFFANSSFLTDMSTEYLILRYYIIDGKNHRVNIPMQFCFDELNLVYL